MVKKFTVDNEKAVKSGNIRKPEYVTGVFKITTSPIIQMTQQHKCHISTQDGKINQDIMLTEENFYKIMQGRQKIFIEGMFDPVHENLAVKQFLFEQGW